jgi:DNA-binding transcriptional LysR family regulator
MNISGRLIDAFLALEETRRFSVAAERCHVSPSAFSQMISRLEEAVGAKLFDRDTRTVSRTAEGQAFSAGAHRIQAEIDSTLRHLSERAALRTGRVALAAPPTLCAEWLPEIMSRHRGLHPNVLLTLHDVVSNRCLTMISSEEVDFGLNAQRGNELEYESTLLFDERMYLLCRHDDPLARRRRVRLKDLKGRPFIHTIRTGSIWQQLAPILAHAQVSDSGLEVAQFGTLAGLVAHGFGISVVPEHALPLCKRQELIATVLSDRQATRPIFMIKRKGRTLSVAAQSLWDHILRAERNFSDGRSPGDGYRYTPL